MVLMREKRKARTGGFYSVEDFRETGLVMLLGPFPTVLHLGA